MRSIGDLRLNALAALLAALAAPAAAQQERLTVDWLFSDEGQRAIATPEHAWLESGSLVIYDRRRPKAERTLESVDLRSGRRRALVDAGAAVAEMNRVIEPDEPLDELGWPAAFGPGGRYAVYEHEGDLFMLDLRRAELRTIARGPDTEEAPRFSPNGEYLAFVRANDLYVHDIGEGGERRLTTDGSETLLNGTLSWVYWEELFNRTDRGYEWSPDSRSIVYLQTDESRVGVMTYVDFEPALPDTIRQRHPKAGTANPNVRAGIVSLTDASTTWIDLGTYPHEYLARVQWLPGGDRLAVQTLDRSQTALDVFLVDAEKGSASHLMRERNEGWINVHDDLHFLPGGDGYLWVSERDGHAHIYHYGMDGELVRQVTRGDRAVQPSGGPAGMTRAVQRATADTVWFTALARNSTERQLYRIRLDGSGFERVSEGDGSHAIHFSPDGDLYLDVASSLDRPPAFTLHRPDGDEVATVIAPDASVAGRFDLGRWELTTVAASDGYEMPAALLKPSDFDSSRRYPAVIYVYGGPSAPTVVNAWPRRARDYFHHMLADRDVVVFYVDNRSAAGRSKTDANTILRQLYGPVELNDLLDGVAWLKSQPYVDGARVGIWGWSGGGTMTMSAMTGSDEFAAGIAVAGVTDWRFYDTIYTERYMRRPEHNEAGYESTSLVGKASDLHGRLFLVHGTYDDNVHPQNTWAFADALIDAGILFDMMIYPMRKHGIADDEAQAHLYRSMLEFWERELGIGD